MIIVHNLRFNIFTFYKKYSTCLRIQKIEYKVLYVLLEINVTCLHSIFEQVYMSLVKLKTIDAHVILDVIGSAFQVLGPYLPYDLHTLTLSIWLDECRFLPN